MIRWLWDGSALLVGAALLDPATGAWTALSADPEDALAPGPQGEIVALQVNPDESHRAALRWVRGPHAGGALPLPPLSAGRWGWTHDRRKDLLSPVRPALSLHDLHTPTYREPFWGPA